MGTIEDFDRLLAKARDHGLEIALDLAYQCSPDHPYVKEHPEWFRHRPDGSVQYAENPPKKYEDIYPFDFECESWRELWEELKDVALFWVRRGVRIFRVDNPHTKPFPFWRWLIEEIQAEFPDVIFLAEAFTRPKVMYDLAKLGFTQSYTYFAWRNTKERAHEILQELTRTEVREYFRPNLWTNTPDILTEYLQYGGRPAFMSRLVLAATLGSNYGVYGPAFELLENRAGHPLAGQAGSEEYLDSEKYQRRQWDIESPRQPAGFHPPRQPHPPRESGIAARRKLAFSSPPTTTNYCATAGPSCQEGRMRSARRAVLRSRGCRFVHSGRTGLRPANGGQPEYSPHRGKPGPLPHSVGLGRVVGGPRHCRNEPYQVHDLLGGARYLWEGPRNFVQLDPQLAPAHFCSSPQGQERTSIRVFHMRHPMQIVNPLWHKEAVIYQLHIRSFCDANDDGIGDFRGLTSKLDYLQDLGVNALWLLPFYPSPLKDDGYDIADYQGVHPMYGTLHDFRTFLREAHDRGLRVITELVLNHTSDEHSWFKRARNCQAGQPLARLVRLERHARPL